MKTISDTKQENTAKTSVTIPICENTNLDGIDPSNLVLTAKLPKPPSVNHIYGRSGKRTYITKKGTIWFADAGYKLQEQMTQKNPVTVACAIRIQLYTCRIQDIDNILKPLLDLLQKYNVLKNDNLIEKLSISKFKVKKEHEHVSLQLFV